MPRSTSRLVQTLRRMGGGPPESTRTDADLLAQFVRERDEAAFEELLSRHGRLVLRTCCRHVGYGPDADDAFQATFIVLARDACRIRGSAAAWLFHVATHIERKLVGQNARRRTQSLDGIDVPASAVGPELDRRELQAAIEDEIMKLPHRLRSAAVLCWLEERSAAEAAALLGCPRGTVESRLVSARRRLRVRLLRHGIAPAVGAGVFDQSDVVAAPALVRRTLAAAVQMARTGSVAGATAQNVVALVAGVTMTNNRLMPIVAALLVLGILGGAGVAALHADADDKPAKKPEAAALPRAKPADNPKLESPPKEDGESKIGAMAKSAREIHQAIQSPFQPGIEQTTELPLSSWIAQFKSNRIPVFIDVESFAKDPPIRLYGDASPRIKIQAMPGATVEQVLREVLDSLSSGVAETPSRLTFRIQEGMVRLLRVPNENPAEKSKDGDLITLYAEEKPLSDVLLDLNRRTGANIVLDVRANEKAKTAVSASLSDVRLLPALRALCDMCDLQPVRNGNLVYVTSRENAQRLQREIDYPGEGDAALPPKPKSMPPSNAAKSPDRK